MFLNQLSNSEKKMFLDLSVHIAQANGVLAAEEKTMISQYCNEMQLPAMELYETRPLETVTDYFSLADDKVKKIVILEILGLVYADGEYDDTERTVVKTFADAIGVSNDDYTQMHDAIIEYYKVCLKMAEIVK